MRTWMVAVAWLALVAVGGVALGDGMAIVPPQLRPLLAEQMQLAVVDVRPDNTVEVDLFISLNDTSGQSHEVPFLLPLRARRDD